MIYDEIAALLRRGLELVGCPGLGGTQRLIAYLAPVITYISDPDARMAVCVSCENGLTTLKGPWDDAESLAYLIGQALGDSAPVMLFALTGALASYSLLEWLQGHWNARSFQRAWLLPEATLHLPEVELARLAACTVETVRIRRLERQEMIDRGEFVQFGERPAA
jgi:hypothetical protein